MRFVEDTLFLLLDLLSQIIFYEHGKVECSDATWRHLNRGCVPSRIFCLLCLTQDFGGQNSQKSTSLVEKQTLILYYGCSRNLFFLSENCMVCVLSPRPFFWNNSNAGTFCVYAKLSEASTGIDLNELASIYKRITRHCQDFQNMWIFNILYLIEYFQNIWTSWPLFIRGSLHSQDFQNAAIYTRSTFSWQQARTWQSEKLTISAALVASNMFTLYLSYLPSHDICTWAVPSNCQYLEYHTYQIISFSFKALLFCWINLDAYKCRKLTGLPL